MSDAGDLDAFIATLRSGRASAGRSAMADDEAWSRPAPALSDLDVIDAHAAPDPDDDELREGTPLAEAMAWIQRQRQRQEGT